MRLMSIAIKTIRVAKHEIAVFLANSVLLTLVYNLYMDSVFLLYPILLSSSVLVVYLVMKGISTANFFKCLKNAKILGDDYYSGDEMQNLVFETITEIHTKHIGEISHLNTQINTRNTLFSQLIHGMKSSVAVIELACEKLDDGEITDDITAENERLKKSLEQALNLLRLDAFANDYIPERVDLAMLATRIINDHKRDFIYAGVFPKLNGTAVVYTDAKWCGFIISQLISNAVKYSNTGGIITFDIEALEEYAELHITDNGSGISSEDLPRVFDMFFTGANGRQRKDSTGIGLFMVKHIADRLGVAVNIHSEAGKGTTVTLIFRNLTKM